MRKFCLLLTASALIYLLSVEAEAAANFVYHEQSGNFVAQPVPTNVAMCTGSTVDEAGGRYLDSTDLSPSSPAPFGAFHIYSGAYTLRFKIEFQFFTDQVRVFYTTDGTNPTTAVTSCGAGCQDVNPTGTTQEVTAAYTYVYSDQSQGCQIVDIATATIPAQAAGTTVKYTVVAWHSGGGDVIYANSGTCPSCFSCTSDSCANVFEYTTVAPPPPLIVSEFRLRGPGGAEDEFVELYNNSDSDVTVSAFDGSAGFGLAASDGAVRFTVPNGTTIPARSHYLGTNTDGYTLSAYPAGLATTATGDAVYTDDINDNAGLALFYTSNPTNFSEAVRMDAVGSASESNSLYREGTGYPALSTDQAIYDSPHDTSLFRSLCSFAPGAGCTTPGVPKDSGDNESDFLLVDADQSTPYCTPTANFACERLGAPGPENSSSPVQRNSTMSVLLLDRSKSSAQSPNRFRDFTSDPVNNSAQGTLSIRRRVVNNTGQTVTRLRFRVVEITTYPPAPDFADLRVRTSAGTTATGVGDADTCADSGVPAFNPCAVTVQATTLEEPPTQVNGGGFNSTVAAGSVLTTPIPPGGSVNVEFLLGLQTTGLFRFYINVEAETEIVEAIPPRAKAAAARDRKVLRRRRSAR